MFKNLFKATVGAVVLPLDVAADLITLGGATTDQAEPYTSKRIGEIRENIDKAVDPDEE